MCDVTYAAMMIASTALTAYSQNEQAKAQQKMYNYNAAVTEEAAKDATVRGVEAQDAQRAKVRTMLSQQRAMSGITGVDSGSGSSGSVMDTTVALGEEDIGQIRLNAMREAWGLRSKAAGERYSGDVAAAGGRLQAWSTILGSAAQGYGQYAKSKKNGSWL